MNRTGWAAAVGSLYRTRAGHTVDILEYVVSCRREEGRAITESIVGSVQLEKEKRILYCFLNSAGGCTNLNWLGGGSTEALPLADFDLIEAVQPAQITKRVECKNDLATRPKVETARATVVPRKDLP